jgi:TatD DNase family protein
MYFDSHAHYNDEQFDTDRDELLQVMPSNSVSYIINCGTDLSSSLFSIELANKYPFIYAAVGIHPEDVSKNESLDEIKKLAQNKKVVAIGEIGLDYYWDTSTKEKQIEYFKNQLHLANELNLPVIIHDRDAHKDTLDIMMEYPEVKGIVHCFSGSVEFAKECVRLGYYIGITGVVTFKNGRKLKEVVESTPLERIVLETDCPYLAPEPFRGHRNHSGHLNMVVEKIAEIKNVSKEEVVEQTRKNALKIYNIGLIIS